ncbi:hypothetical protein [Haloarcula vallismortis]|nr:hypothetical protein [Haloarcula vallismortis]
MTGNTPKDDDTSRLPKVFNTARKRNLRAIFFGERPEEMRNDGTETDQ